MAAASPTRPPYVGTPGPGHSLPPGPKRSRSIRQRKQAKYDMGVEDGDKTGQILLKMTGIAGLPPAHRRQCALPFAAATG